MSAEDIAILKKRLDVDHFTKRTQVFFPDYNIEGLDRETAKKIETRFSAYWRTWCEQDVKKLFDYVVELEEKIKTNEIRRGAL